jgi:hypothetical protein
MSVRLLAQLGWHQPAYDKATVVADREHDDSGIELLRRYLGNGRRSFEVSESLRAFRRGRAIDFGPCVTKAYEGSLDHRLGLPPVRDRQLVDRRHAVAVGGKRQRASSSVTVSPATAKKHADRLLAPEKFTVNSGGAPLSKLRVHRAEVADDEIADRRPTAEDQSVRGRAAVERPCVARSCEVAAWDPQRRCPFAARPDEGHLDVLDIRCRAVDVEIPVHVAVEEIPVALRKRTGRRAIPCRRALVDHRRSPAGSGSYR